MRLQFRAHRGHSKHSAGGVGHTAAAGPLGGYVATTPWQPAAASDAAGSAHLYADTTVAWLRGQAELAGGQIADLRTQIHEREDQIALLSWRCADLQHWLARHVEQRAGEDYDGGQGAEERAGEDYYDGGQGAEERAQHERGQTETQTGAGSEAPVYVHWTPDAISWPLCGDQFARHHTTDTRLVSCPQCADALPPVEAAAQAARPLGLAEPLDARDDATLYPFWLPEAEAHDGSTAALAALDGVLGGAR